MIFNHILTTIPACSRLKTLLSIKFNNISVINMKIKEKANAITHAHLTKALCIFINKITDKTVTNKQINIKIIKVNVKKRASHTVCIKSSSLCFNCLCFIGLVAKTLVLFYGIFMLYNLLF